VTNQREFRKLLKARKKNPDAKLLILYRPIKDPGIFIRPDLCPSGLLKKPIVTAETAALFESVIRKIYKERDEEAPGRRLVVYSGSDRFLVPYSDIFYIEAKDKLLFLYHEQGKICFRDSLKRLEAVLPGSFYRIHRGVIVNLLHIRAIRLQSGKVCMMDSTVIPMSLKFRNEMERILAIWGSWREEESEEQGQNQGKEAKNQGEEMQTQGDEAQTQGEEMQIQGKEMQTQGDEAQEQGDEVENQMDLKVDPLIS